MEVEVEELCDQLSLTELENEELQVHVSPLEEVISKGRNCLFAKLHTSRPYNQEAFMATMRKICRPIKLIHFLQVGSRMMMIEFEDRKDKERVLKKSPWDFEKCLLL